MSKTKFTEADVTRAARGATKGGMDVATIEIRLDGSILVAAKGATAPPVDDPQEMLRLLK